MFPVWLIYLACVDWKIRRHRSPEDLHPSMLNGRGNNDSRNFAEYYHCVIFATVYWPSRTSGQVFWYCPESVRPSSILATYDPL